MEIILKEVAKEVQYQDEKWGTINDDTRNAPNDWVAYIAKYATTWFNGMFPPYNTETVDKFRTSMIKVAALALSAVASIDRQRNATGKTFYED